MLIEKQPKLKSRALFVSAYLLKAPTLTKLALAGCALCLTLFTSATLSSERENRLQDLEALKQEIALISKKISQQERLRTKQSQALESLEKLLAETAAENFAIKTKHKATQVEIDALLKKQTETAHRIQLESKNLGHHLRLLYQLKDQSQLALWLSSRNPVQTQRTAIALRTINDQTASQIESLQSLQLHQSSLEAQLLTSQKQSLEQLKIIEKTSRELAGKREERKKLLNKLDQRLANSVQIRADREKDREALESLIQTLTERLSDRFEAARRAADAYPFARTKGKLQWPASGSQVAKFGQRKANSSRRWQGITIAADEGTTVHSIYSGTVIFADYLPAQGMLIIIDHGEGYWSLYGRNETLVRQVGDFVTTGETIATVGASGGHQSSELYLEVRKNGKPQNPTNWFSKKA